MADLISTLRYGNDSFWAAVKAALSTIVFSSPTEPSLRNVIFGFKIDEKRVLGCGMVHTMF